MTSSHREGFVVDYIVKSSLQLPRSIIGSTLVLFHATIEAYDS
jgi:hypothetical protein